MTMILILCYCASGKEVSDSLQSGKVPDSANVISQINVSSYLIRCQALGRPAWNSHSEEQCWHPTLSIFFNPISGSLNLWSVFPALEAATIILGAGHVGQFEPINALN